MRNIGRNRRSLVGMRNIGAAMTALAIVHSAPALAQDESVSPAAASEAAANDQIVVTGTRIVRDGFQAPTPLTVLGETEIQNSSPTNNIADFVNTLPSLAG